MFICYFNDLMAECTQQELALRLLPLPAQERTGARVSRSRARSFLRPLLPSLRLLRRLCYPGVYSSPKKDGVAYRTD